MAVLIHLTSTVFGQEIRACPSVVPIVMPLTLTISYGLDARQLGGTHLNLTQSLIGDTYEYGAIFSYAGQPEQVIIRVGVSFVSADQACSNAEQEIGDASFEEIWDASKALWNDRLSRIEIDVPNTPENVTEMFYSSLYRSSLTPVVFSSTCMQREG